ncbi:RusA family crossover junction endodeoxyribonuclease [Mannheimia granulomatis]|uniref:RusA family crossover junction endodeoxyribonuclease n=1 Tax=Mannheimia granulomatis TaxID=85402 RepID=UPI000478A4BF|nr:RusA family crossover junction endodeoxyribonuclease [Mannheimia granulomatis]QLB18683.1 endodeoxyribonuclease [Mannheimia granulomatis]
MVELILPYPPSVNNYWQRVGRNKMAVSPRGKSYQWATFLAVQNKPKFGGQVEIECDVYFPDNRDRDLDNLGKCILDSLVYSKIIVDDSRKYVKKLTFEDKGNQKDGAVIVRIKERLDVN